VTDNKSSDIEAVCREARTAIGTMADAQKGLIRNMERVASDLAVIRETLGKTDEDGVALTYAPRRWGVQLEKALHRIDALVDPLGKVVVGQGDLINIIHKIDGRLEHVILEEQKWRGEVRQSLRTLDGMKDDIKEGVKVKVCDGCSAKADAGQAAKDISTMKPQMAEAHQFVLKWKYGFIPFIVVVISSLLTAILKLIEIFTKGGAAPPLTP